MSYPLLWPSRLLCASALAVAGVAVCWSVAADAAATDCDKLEHSTAPYEATMQAGQVKLTYQVTRSDKGPTTVLIRNLDGKVTKLENQSTFPKSMTLPNGESATFEYSVPTDKPLYDQAVKTIHTKLMHGKDVLVDTDTSMAYLPDEKIKVGDCTFDTKHYVQTTTQNGRELRADIWFAPSLDLSLKTLTTIKAGDKQMSQETAAKSLTTSFTPFK